MEAKDLIALALLLLAIPAGIIVATFSQRARDAAFFLMVAGTVITDRLDVNFLSHYWYRGTTRGLEFSLVDLLAISVCVGSVLAPRPGNSRFYWPASLGLTLVFFLYAVASVMFSEPSIYGVFELSKMVRGFCFFLAAAFYVRSQREVGILVLALCCAVCFEGVLALKQRMIGGMDRVAGSLDHENSLSMYMCLVAPIFVAAATSSLPKLLRTFSIVALGAAALCSVLTVSRAGVPIFALVTLGAAAFCVSWRITPKKILATALIVLCIAGLSFKTWDSLKGRYAEASFQDEYLDDQVEGRGYYLRLAKVVVEDKFFGVGLNNWSFWVSKKYGAIVGRPYDSYGDLHSNKPDEQTIENLVWAAPAHNLAALTVGELGVPGLLLFMLLWGRWFQMSLRFLFERTPEGMHRLGVGFFFCLCGIFLHSLTEWTFRQTHIFLTFNILVGTLASLCYAKRHARKPAVEAAVFDDSPEYEYPRTRFNEGVTMRVIHLLRKYDPAEWGGTETAVQRLCDGLRQQDVTSLMYCPHVNDNGAKCVPPVSAARPVRSGKNRLTSSAVNNGHDGGIKRYRTCVPTWGATREAKRQLISVGGNLISFDLLPAMWREPDVALVHTHTLGRLGGIASAVARGRGLPFVVSIHGGLLDVSSDLKTTFTGPSQSGLDWGKIFGFLFQSRQLIQHADAVLACNLTEAELLRKQHPDKRVEIQPHGIPVGTYQQDHRPVAREVYPQIVGRDVLLCVGRIDPVKNQSWLVTHAPEIFRNHPQALLVLVGACTNEAYGQSLKQQIHDPGLDGRVLLTGGLPQSDPRLIGLIQESRAVLSPSISETFGLVLLEAWAAGTTVISSRTSGASALIRNGENGWLFDLSDPKAFHQAVNQTLLNPGLRTRLAESGRQIVTSKYDVTSVAGRVKQLYSELIEEKHALRHSA